jgi:hypothetical protein
MKQKRSQKMDRRVATNTLAKLTAKWFANDEDTENNVQLENLEMILKQQYPNEYKKIESAALNLALGNRSQMDV